MEPLCFRPPQFSEDSAWLPSWLQQHQVENFDECIKETLDPSLLTSKALTLLHGKNINEGMDAILLPNEDKSNKSFHLFFSGDDNSPSSFASSFYEHAPQLRLHLSLDGYSQCGPSQVTRSLALNATQVLHQPTIPKPMQQVENSICFKDTSRSRLDCNTGGSRTLAQDAVQESSGRNCPHSSYTDKDSMKSYGETFNVRRLKGADINNTVELSITASEAVAIHETVKSGLDLEALTMEDVLEAALRMKQSRLEMLEDTSYCSYQSSEENESFSDLDDLTMEDAFKDVGVSCNTYYQCASDLAISQVKETPVSQNAKHCSFKEFCSQEDNLDVVARQTTSDINSNLNAIVPKYLSLESPCCQRQMEISDHLVLDLNTSNVGRYDPLPPKNPEVLISAQIVDSDVAHVLSSCPQADEASYAHASCLEIVGKNRVNCQFTERFRSRWLGGWTAKVLGSSMQLKENKFNSNAFAGETSFLSESAHIAPDENSFVQIQETRCHIGSQSSIRIEDFQDETSHRIILSQDLVKSSSLSFIDPLCSVVPCSISLNNDAESTAIQYQKHVEIDAENQFGPVPELQVENSQGTSSLNAEFQHAEGKGTSAVKEDYSCSVRRLTASLKSYSTVFPYRLATFDGGRLQSKLSLQPESNGREGLINQNMRFMKSSDKRTKKVSLFRSVSAYSSREGDEKNQENVVSGEAPEKEMNCQRYNSETAGCGSDSLLLSPKDGKQPLILKHNKCRRLQALKPSAYSDSTGEKKLKLTSAPESDINPENNKKIQTLVSDSNNSLDDHFPARKRVCFLGAEIQVNRNKNLQKPHSSMKIHGKRLSLQGMQFLLTGFSGQKEREIEGLIWKHGGVILPDIPSPTNSRGKKYSRSKWHQLPVVLCSKKLQTTKFLYGCAVNAFILKVEWLADSVGSGCILPPEKAAFSLFLLHNHLGSLLSCSLSSTPESPPVLDPPLDLLTVNIVVAGLALLCQLSSYCRLSSLLNPIVAKKYMILSRHPLNCKSIRKPAPYKDDNYIFAKVGIMLHGKHSFCTKLAKIIKHGGGKVFRTLRWLLHSRDKTKISFGAIVAEEDNNASRHLKHCAFEQNITMMPASWIVKSLYLGELIPLEEEYHSGLPRFEIAKVPIPPAMSEEV